jgi:hypothetical protein
MNPSRSIIVSCWIVTCPSAVYEKMDKLKMMPEQMRPHRLGWEYRKDRLGAQRDGDRDGDGDVE